MRRAIGHVGVVLLLTLAPGSSMAQTSDSRKVFDFTQPEFGDRWFVVNDDVMGGVSSSMLRLDDDGFAVFEGTMSLENNGGFASVRGAVERGRLAGATRLDLRVRGDGQTYQLRLRMGGAFDGIAYATSFETKQGEWSTVSIPLSSLQPTYRGYRPRNVPPLDAAAVRQIGFMLTDKQDGPFRLEIGWIEAVSD